MDKAYNSLDDILDDPELADIFTATKPASMLQTADQRLIDSFEEINQFIDQHGHEPQDRFNLNHRKLIKRLDGIRNDTEKSAKIQPFDRHNLLQGIETPLESLDDILNADFLQDILNQDNSANDIFNLKHVSHSSERQEADFIARRKACQNFAKYEPLFKQCQRELKTGQRKLITFDEQNLVAGAFFVLNGQIGYLESVTAPVKRGGNRHDGRIYCVFENGTESNMQFLSLAARLYEARKDAQAFTVSESQQAAENKFNQGFGLINEEDQQTGFIYVLKSKSTNPKITAIDDLYKIGYSTTPVEERIKNAANEPTYLMATVEIIAVYECYNLNPQKFEHIMHTFFAAACLSLEVFGLNNKRYNPREWFIVPIQLINQAIELIQSGRILNFEYDHSKRKVQLRKA